MHSLRHVDAVRDALAVGDNQRWPGMSFRFEKGLEGLSVACAHRYLRNVNVAVPHRGHAEILFDSWLATGGKFRDRTERGGFRRLAAGV